MFHSNFLNGHNWISTESTISSLMEESLPNTKMMSSNGNIFRVTGHLCGEFTGPRWIPAQRPVTRSFDVLFDLSE